MNFFILLFALFAVVNSQSTCKTDISKPNVTFVSNQCVQFSVSAGTGCAWMCSYCASQLGTNNYYFTDNVCVYQEGVGCTGNPIAGKMYTCCSV